MALTFDTCSKSIAGSVHPHEDRILVDEKRMLLAIADGVTRSSRGSGGIAAQLAVKLLHENFSSDIVRAVRVIHEKITEMKLKDDSIGETTLTAAAVMEGRADIVNVGDSPACLIRGGSLQNLIHEDKDAFGYITQVLGYPEEIHVHLTRVPLEIGDYLILASDGVAHVLTESTIIPVVKKDVSAKALVETVIERAQRQSSGYDDDKSVIVVKVLSV